MYVNDLFEEDNGDKMDKRIVGMWEYDMTKELSETSSYGKVYKARHKITGKTYAVKSISLNFLEIVKRELEIGCKVIHDNIVKVYYNEINYGSLHIVMEYAADGDLCTYVNKKYPLPEEEIKNILKQLLNVINFLHVHLIAHHDIKLENLLVFKQDKKTKIKLIDFGFATKYKSLDSKEHRRVGSLHYAAPELLKDDRYNPFKTDIWAIGVVLYTIIEGKYPFDEAEDNEEIYCMKVRHRIINSPIVFTNKAKEAHKSIILKILTKKIEDRPTIQEILEDDYLN